MTEELESLKRVIERLNKGNFGYYLTGSMAMSFYFIPRMTRDSDILIQLTESKAQKFFDIFKDDFHIDLDMIRDSIQKQFMFNIWDKKTLFKIDFIFVRDNEYETIKFN